MKAEELVKLKSADLRLGNWIKHAPHKHWIESIHDKPVEVCIDILQEVYFRDNLRSAPMYLPIPLTPEILEKAGFVHDKWKDWNISLISDNAYLTSNKEGTEVWADKPFIEQDGSWYDFNVGRSVSYLHELQNLYFSLVGSELPINL